MTIAAKSKETRGTLMRKFIKLNSGVDKCRPG